MKRNVSVIVGLAFMIFGRFLPAFPGLSASGMQVIGIFIGTLIMWLTIAINWPSLLCIAMLAMVPELTLNKLLVAGVGNSTFSFFNPSSRILL